MARDARAQALENGLLPIMRVEGQDIRRPMAERFAHYNVPGISVAVIEDDKIAWAEGFGVQEAGTDRKVEADTMMAGASISKPVAAVVALKLVERGLLHLDRNVNDVLKAWKVPENEFTREQPVTLRWLLSHRAGTTVHGFGGLLADPTLIDTLEGRPPAKNAPVRVDKTPGGSPRYSGGGFTIAQLLMEEATGKSFVELADELVFQPLGMTRTTFAQPLPERFHPFASCGHNEDGSVIAERFSSCPQLAAGGIFTTAPDYARFMIACRAAYLGKPNRLLGPALGREMMERNGTSDQGLGWRVISEAPHMRFEHGGSCQGYQCETTMFLERGQGVVVLTNAVGGLSFYWEVINTVADLHGWQGYLPPAKRIQLFGPDDLERYTGRFKIVSGVDAPEIKIWQQDGKLFNQITGMRGGPRQVWLDDKGRMFNQAGPFETEIRYGDDGRAVELIVLEGGTSEVLRAVREDLPA